MRRRWRRSGLRTRLMVTCGSVLLAMVLVLAGVTAGVVTAQSRAVERRLLDDRSQAAVVLLQRSVAPRRVVAELDNPMLSVRIILPDGSRVGRGAPPGWARRSTTVERGSSAGATVVIGVSPATSRQSRNQVLLVILVSGLGVLLLGGLGIAAAVRWGLRPLDSVTATAVAIASGQRGRRVGRADRTDVGRTAAAVDAMLGELEGAERRAASAERRLREFLADAAHELRTPLAGIRAAGETLLTTTDPGSRDQLHELLGMEIRRASTLVDDLVEITRLDDDPRIEPTDLDLDDLARQEVGRLRVTHPGLQLEVVGTAPTVQADAERIGQVVRNLLENAAAASSDGRIRVLLGEDRAADREWVVLEVRDDGPGIPPAERDLLFERRRRGRSSQGSGLGLAIARGWARAHGGELLVLPPVEGESGARLRLLLPRHTDQTKSPSTRVSQPSSSPPGSAPSTSPRAEA